MTETAAADLHAEIAQIITTLRAHAPQPDPDFYPEGEDAGQVCKWALDDLADFTADWQRRTVRLADAVEQLHDATHDGSLLLCSQAPCSGLFVDLAEGRKASR